jgi:hypothetical protein
MAAPRVKMRLLNISAPLNGTVTLQMQCAYNDTVPEDVTISAIFPAGQITLTCKDAPTIAELTMGAAYYVDFSLAAVQPANILGP